MLPLRLPFHHTPCVLHRKIKSPPAHRLKARSSGRLPRRNPTRRPRPLAGEGGGEGKQRRISKIGHICRQGGKIGIESFILCRYLSMLTGSLSAKTVYSGNCAWISSRPAPITRGDILRTIRKRLKPRTNKYDNGRSSNNLSPSATCVLLTGYSPSDISTARGTFSTPPNETRTRLWRVLLFRRSMKTPRSAAFGKYPQELPDVKCTAPFNPGKFYF